MTAIADLTDVGDLLADEWPYDRVFLDWSLRRLVVADLLEVLTANGFTVIADTEARA